MCFSWRQGKGLQAELKINSEKKLILWGSTLPPFLPSLSCPSLFKSKKTILSLRNFHFTGIAHITQPCHNLSFPLPRKTYSWSPRVNQPSRNDASHVRQSYLCCSEEWGFGNFSVEWKKKHDAYLPQRSAAGLTFPHANLSCFLLCFLAWEPGGFRWGMKRAVYRKQLCLYFPECLFKVKVVELRANSCLKNLVSR